MKHSDFTGTWQSEYRFHDGNAAGMHTVRFQLDGNTLAGRSLDQEDGSVLVMRLEFDGQNALTGTWSEITSPGGPYAGKVFHGALQLLADDTATRAAGEWVGFNSSRDQVNHGSWSLQKP